MVGRHMVGSAVLVVGSANGGKA